MAIRSIRSIHRGYLTRILNWPCDVLELSDVSSACTPPISSCAFAHVNVHTLVHWLVGPNERCQIVSKPELHPPISLVWLTSPCTFYSYICIMIYNIDSYQFILCIYIYITHTVDTNMYSDSYDWHRHTSNIYNINSYHSHGYGSKWGTPRIYHESHGWY